MRWVCPLSGGFFEHANDQFGGALQTSGPRSNTGSETKSLPADCPHRPFAMHAAYRHLPLHHLRQPSSHCPMTDTVHVQPVEPAALCIATGAAWHQHRTVPARDPSPLSTSQVAQHNSHFALCHPPQDSIDICSSLLRRRAAAFVIVSALNDHNPGSTRHGPVDAGEHAPGRVAADPRSACVVMGSH